MSLLSNKTVLIIGLGLIGGSIARGLRTAMPALRLLAVDKDTDQLNDALSRGVIDEATVDPARWAATADLIILAVPSLAVSGLLATLKNSVSAEAVITDVASVKFEIVKAAEVLGQGQSRFVPGHPIAGSEKSGFSAADSELFRQRKVILTPGPDTDCDAVKLVHELWRLLGAEILGMSPGHHDEVLAATSHLPHLLSYALVDVLVNNRQSEDIFRYAAGGFADFSRLASSDPTMWADIFTANASATVAVLDVYIDHLEVLKQALSANNHRFLKDTFIQAKQSRDAFIRKAHNPMTITESQQHTAIEFHVKPGGSVSGDIRVPGDKSISHRAIIFGAIAQGITRVTGFLEGADALNTLDAFRELGVTIIGPENGNVQIYGVGLYGLSAPRKPLYMGNSGTAMRLLAGLLAPQVFKSSLTGDESLSRRPMGRVAEPLTAMGARIETEQDGTPPLVISGTELEGIDYPLPVASAQVKSAILLAGIYARGETRLTEPAPCRDHTERLLQGFGYPVEVNGNSVTIPGRGQELTACDIDVPADISSAAFFLVAATICPDASLILRHVGINPTRTGVIQLLQLMGADIELQNPREVSGEPVADIQVRSAPLNGITIPPEMIPLAIDEFPVLFVAAACARGKTVLRGAQELRVKESDRLQAMADGLSALGIEVSLYPDGIDITGGAMGGGTIDSHGDHRIAMAFTVAGLRCRDPLIIQSCENVGTSFPGFVGLANEVGMPVEALNQPIEDPVR